MEDLEALGLEIVSNNEIELDSLDKFTKAGYTISEILYILGRLRSIGPWKASELTQDLLYEINTLNTALAVAYGRLFAQSDATKINPRDVPDKWKKIHEELRLQTH